MNLNKDPSSWATVHAASVPGWPAGVIISFVNLALQDIATLARELEGEREGRAKLERALRQKDEAMGVLFDRLAKAGVDCSDLFS